MTDQTSDRTEPAPIATERKPWDVVQFETRFQALTRVGTNRKPGVDIREAKALFDEMVEALVELTNTGQALADGKERALKNRAALRHENAALREELERRTAENPGEDTPTVAVKAVAGAMTQSERIIDNALAQARLTIANADEEARRRLAAAHLHAQGVVPPNPSGNVAADFLARARYLAAALPAVEQQAIDLRTEYGQFAEVLPLAQVELARPTLDVSEVA